jgi:hypothetical protein
MELLLNLLWLMLAVPALLIWRRQSMHAPAVTKQSFTRALVLLGCLLTLLFPIVSATDDLRPLNAEIEDSGACKRSVKQSPGARSTWTFDGGTPAVLVQASGFGLVSGAFREVSEATPVLLPQVLFSKINDRAPPQA